MTTATRARDSEVPGCARLCTTCHAEHRPEITRASAVTVADFAVSEACVDCHNNHRDSPRTDIELGDVIGGVVFRIPME